MTKKKIAIIGSGNIGTDLMIKVMRLSEKLEMGVMVGIDEKSDGLARAAKWGFATTHKGIDGLMEMPEWNDIAIIFDATSAKAHLYNAEKITHFPDKKIVDLTPAAIGPYTVPAVSLDPTFWNHPNFSSLPKIDFKEIKNVNMVTCGGQATIPMVAAVNRIAKVHYGEIIATIASKSAGPGTRANIDEFTETTASAIEKIGGAEKGKAIIILNPAEPPLIMRDTVMTLSEMGDQEAIRKSVEDMVRKVQRYVSGYQLHQEVQFEEIPADKSLYIEGLGYRHGLKTTVLLKVKGAGHYLPEYAGNLDIMTSAALAVGELISG